MTKNSRAGFSLVELMVSVAIIGVLSSIAVPNIMRYVAKSKQAEVKTMLASLYASEKAFYATYTTYDPRIILVGYTPEGGLRYNVGFGSGGDIADASNGYIIAAGALAVRTTLDYCRPISSGGKKGGGGPAPVTFDSKECATLTGANGQLPDTIPAVVANVANATAVVNKVNGTFLAAGTSSILQGSQADVWTMDQNKLLSNVQSGLVAGSAPAPAGGGK